MSEKENELNVEEEVVNKKEKKKVEKQAEEIQKLLQLEM